MFNFLCFFFTINVFITFIAGGLFPQKANAYDIDLKEYFPIDREYVKLFVERDLNSSENATDYFIVTYTMSGVEDGIAYYKRSERMGLDNFPEIRDYDFFEIGWGQEAVLVREIYSAPEDGDEEEHQTFDPARSWFPRYLDLGKNVQTDSVEMMLKATDLTIVVPQGSFSHCIELQYTVVDEPECVNSMWLAPGVGVVKMQETCEDEVNESELVATNMDGEIQGSPYCPGNAASFALATASGIGCSVVINGIAITGYSTPFWARFDLDLNSLSLVLDVDSVGIGAAPPMDVGCVSVPGMDFGVEPVRVWDCISGYANSYAGLFVAMEYAGEKYFLEFSFDINEISFKLRSVWDSKGELIWRGW